MEDYNLFLYNPLMVVPRFTLRQLDAYVTAAELNNFSYAAKRLNLTASAISNLITELEQSLGFALFERTTRKVAITTAGREFLPAAVAVRRQMAHAQLLAADIGQQSYDVIRIAAPLALAASLLPNLLSKFQQSHPRASVRIVDAAVEWLIDRVSIGDAHLAIGPLRSARSDVIAIPLFDSPWMLWMAPTDALRGQSDLLWSDLADRRVFAAGRDHEEAIFGASTIERRSDVEVVENITTAFGLAAAGLGVTFSPGYVEPLATSMGLIGRPFETGAPPRRVALYKPAQIKHSHAVREFERYLLDHFTKNEAVSPLEQAQ